MTKWITLNQAAAKYETDARNIQYWGKSGAITVARIGETWMVDDSSVISYLENNKKVENMKEELLSLQEDYKLQIANCIETNDERLFLLKAGRGVTSLFRMMINEMAGLLECREKREVFARITKGESVNSIAQRMELTYDKVSSLYEKALREVSQKYVKSRILRDEKAGWLKELHQTQIKLRNLENRVGYLERENALLRNAAEAKEQQNKSLVSRYPDINDEVLDRLFLRFEDIPGFDTRAKNVFRAADIITVEDFLRKFKKNGWSGLLNNRNFGHRTLRLLKEQLETMGIIDKNGNSRYFRYLEVKEDESLPADRCQDGNGNFQVKKGI